MKDAKNPVAMKWKIDHATFGLGALLALLLVLGAATLWSMQPLTAAWRWQAHAYEVLG